METRKERKGVFNPEKQDPEKLALELNWEADISQVMLVKAANKAWNLEGRKKYMANAESCRILSMYFETKFSPLIKIKQSGKDRFYSLRAGYNKEQVLAYSRGEEITVLKEDLEKKGNGKYYIPDIPETFEETKKTVKNIFPDNEVLAKTAILIHFLIKGKGSAKSSIFNSAREEFGWKYQRSIEGKPFTSYLEVNRFFTEYFEIENPIILSRKGESHYEWSKEDLLDDLKEKIKIVISLIDDDVLKEKITKYVTDVPEKPVEEEKPKEIPKEKKTPITEKTEVTIPERPRVVKTSPVVGKSEIKDMGVASPIVYEQSRVRWNKSLVAMALKGAERGVWYNFSDISNVIKRTRYVEISARDIKEICGDVSKQFKGIFREVDFGGITIGSEFLVRDFVNTYPQEKITETIFVRLFYGLTEIQEEYPELSIKIASAISEKDNIFEIEMNRAECTEKAFARLVYKMRPGEIVLESSNNWVVKRTKILIDKLVNL